MKINKMGINHTHNQSFGIERPTGSGDYLFLLIKTPAIFHINGKQILAEKHSVIIYNKGTPQLYGANGSTYTDDYIHFTADSDWELRNISFDTLLTLPSVRQISKILKDIYLEFISNNANREDSIDLLLKLLFTKINELLKYQPQGKMSYSYYDTLVHLRSLIYSHPEEKWTIARLSNQANLSSSYFQRLYKITFGVSCKADVITSKIEFSKTYLNATSSSVREIAGLCGYENEEHFMRQFKQNVGVTPSEYRRKIRD